MRPGKRSHARSMCFPGRGRKAQSNLMARGARWLISLFRSRRVRRELELTASRVNRRVELPSDKVLVTEKVILLRVCQPGPIYETCPDSHARREIVTLGSCSVVWVKGFSHRMIITRGRWLTAKRLFHKSLSEGTSFPHPRLEHARTDRAGTLLWTASSHDMRSAAV